MSRPGPPHPPDEPPPLDRLLFDSPLLRIGAFRAPPSHPRFHDSGPAENDIFVFPRTSVWLQHEGGKRFVVDPNSVTFYNKGQVYRRGKVSEEGDHCEWFAFRPQVLVDAVRAHDPAVVEHPDQPFSFSHGPSDPRSYLVQRLLVRQLMKGELIEPLRVEETMLHVLARLLGNAAEMYEWRSLPATVAIGGDLVEETKAVLARSFREPLSLQEIAGRIGFSVFHLCRLFRRGTGTTLHGYRNHLRLRTALEEVADPRADLSALGLDLGYSSHSHFTSAFRQAFGTTPSTLRRTASGPRVRELASRLLAEPPPRA
ncbi:MAG TPA: helix-turn-helix transcriptional regulator [Thermoanaerobaculia bacterium]|nr:helix-turn-helix transcriptional regulator [Thermoanaerobaculia bacterium]